MLNLRFFFVVLPLTAVLGGCGPDGLDEQSGESSGQEPAVGAGSHETEPTLGTATQELPYLGTYSWISPDDATPMGSTADRVCVLNRIRGVFDIGNEAVYIYGSGGSWFLGGRGGSSTTRAVSRCASRSAGNVLSGEYTWAAGQRLPTNMGSTDGRVCFLSRVSGSFNSSADWVRVYASGGSWFLFGDSQAMNGTARARCITVSTFSAEYSWSQSQGHPTYMGSTSGQICALTYMSGAFDSLSEYIDISASAGAWYLGGDSAHSGVAAKARCF